MIDVTSTKINKISSTQAYVPTYSMGRVCKYNKRVYILPEIISEWGVAEGGFALRQLFGMIQMYALPTNTTVFWLGLGLASGTGVNLIPSSDHDGMKNLRSCAGLFTGIRQCLVFNRVQKKVRTRRDSDGEY